MKLEFSATRNYFDGLSKKIKLIIGFVLLLHGFIFLILLSDNPVISPDGEDILRMASIYAAKSCISYLDSCAPTSTDHGPFYPLIGAFFYKFTKSPVKLIIYLQTFVHIVSCTAFVIYIGKAYRIKFYESTILFGLSLVNPISIGWQRFILPDTYGLDIALLTLLAIDLYRNKNDFKFLFLAVILINFGSLLRYDTYLLLIPLICVYLFKNIKGWQSRKSYLKIGFFTLNLCLVSSIFLTFWSVRNIKLGLPATRDAFFSIHHQIRPEVIDWIKTWTISTYDLPKGIYPYLSGSTKTKVTPPSWALDNNLKLAINDDPQLRKIETAQLAAKKAKSLRSNFLLNNFNNIKRILWITSGPLYSGGLNLLYPIDYFDPQIIKIALIKFLNFFSRITCFLLALNLYRNNPIANLKILNTALCFLIVDIGFCLYLGQLEQRYLNDSILFLQFSFLLEYLHKFRLRV